jgi:hypothetical protein
MRTVPSLSIDTKMLTDRLAKLGTGEMVPYAELSSLIGRNVQKEARGNLMSAMRRLLADGSVFGTVRGQGVKRLTDLEIVGCGPEIIGRVRRAARRAGAKLANIQDFDALPPEAQTTHNMALSVVGVLAHMTKAGTVRKLEERIEAGRQALPLRRTLEVLGGGKTDGPT